MGLVFVQNWWRSGRVAVADTNGGGVTILTDKVNVSSVDVSPDGSQIVFDGLTPGESTKHIYVVNVDGTGTRRVTRDTASETTPAWSPDGKRVAYVHAAPAGGYEPANLYIARVSDGQTTRITNEPTGGAVIEPAWSPDGRQLAVVVAPGLILQVMNADGSGRHALPVPDGFSYMDAPTWSPDGQYVLAPAGDVTHLKSRLFLYDLKAGTSRQLLNSATTVNHEIHPSWSRDGVWIAFASGRVPSDGGTRIYKVHPDGAGLTPLTAGTGDAWPRWR